MLQYPRPLSDLIDTLSRIPTIGKKTAGRIALHLLQDKELALDISSAITEALNQIKECSICNNISTDDICEICASPRRDKSLITVISDVRDLIALENATDYNGTYHILGGLISPLNNITPATLNIDSLLRRTQDSEEEVVEVIIATNHSIEGDATALYLANILKPRNIKVSRIALGLPVGGDLDYADQITIMRSIAGRTEL